MGTMSEGAGATARKVDQLLEHYGESHQNPRNERIHFVAIPLIMLSLLGLLTASTHGWLTVLWLPVWSITPVCR